MKTLISRSLGFSKTGLATFFFTLALFRTEANAQAVTGIITDYNQYWKTSSNAVNTVKPNNSHNLLAFTYNGVQYATGVNNERLVERGETFNAQDFWSLPVGAISGTINGNTKVGFGAMYDGVANGPSNPAPEYGISSYLTDGIKGLNIGTCIANLPAGTMSFLTGNIQPSAIGDGIPDILVTQIADPSGNNFDRYEFRDGNGVRVGTFKDIIFNNIPTIATWTADFYNATNPMTLSGGFTHTDRPIRLWAADLSEFGITSSNYNQIRNFTITLCGNSDIAFVAYNNSSLTFQSTLPVQYNFFKAQAANEMVNLNWQTASEQNADQFVVERSADGNRFEAIGSLTARNGIVANNYSFIDKRPLQGNNFYRLKQIDRNGSFQYSTIVKVSKNGNSSSLLTVYPNPANGNVWVNHEAATKGGTISLYNTSGALSLQLKVAPGTMRSSLDLSRLAGGTYHLVWQTAETKLSAAVVVGE